MAKHQHLSVLITILFSLISSSQSNCTLCEDGSSVPSPFQDGLSGMTCAELAIDAGLDAPENCIYHQGVVGTYCGCNNTVSAESVCRICFPDLLPDYLRVVDGRTCMQYEYRGSLDNSCAIQRHLYGSDCCASVNETSPSAAPSMYPTSNSTFDVTKTNETSKPSIAPTTNMEPTSMPSSLPPTVPPTIRPTPALMGQPPGDRNSPSGSSRIGCTFFSICVLSWIFY